MDIVQDRQQWYYIVKNYAEATVKQQSILKRIRTHDLYANQILTNNRDIINLGLRVGEHKNN